MNLVFLRGMPGLILDELNWRGLIADVANRPELELMLHADAKPTGVYIGFDPTSDSLHVGSLVGILLLKRFQEAGHRPIALAGGATGMIGDPSGKSAERNLQTPELLEQNLAGIQKQLARFLDFGDGSAKEKALLLDNATWTKPLSLLDFLRDVGKHFTVNTMMTRDSVRSRLEGNNGISFTEFSYSLLQALDFQKLYEMHGCMLQAGGSDQWGNITAGIDLIWRTHGKVVCGLTTPLLVKSDGTKFGKTESGAVWLSAEKTSPYQFYQFFLQVEDAKVGELLRLLTFLPQEQVLELDKAQSANPEKRQAQQALAEAVTTLVHGKAATEQVARVSEVLFGGSADKLTGEDLAELFKEVPSFKLEGGPEWPLIDLLVTANLAPSKGQARRDIESGGIYVNNNRAADAKAAVTSEQLLAGAYLLLRKGRKNYALLKREA